MSELSQFEAVPPDHRSGFVAIIGRPNVGKSTLLNQLLEYKVAIVSPKPQTTRTRIRGILTREDAQIIFVDTPGLHDPVDMLGETLVATAESTIPDADVILFMTDVSQPPTKGDQMIAEMICKHTKKPVLLVLNKMDLLPPESVSAQTEAHWDLIPDRAGWMMTSASDGVNLDKLMELLIEHLPEGPRYYPSGQITDQTEREIAAELVREQVLRLTRHEVPHAVAVVVDEFKEREHGVFFLSASIHVERDSQKGILIGKRGQMLKNIGVAARKEIERMLGGRVYLDLHVKTTKNWRRDPNQIRDMGY